jgi:hypothetical protein
VPPAKPTSKVTPADVVVTTRSGFVVEIGVALFSPFLDNNFEVKGSDNRSSRKHPTEPLASLADADPNLATSILKLASPISWRLSLSVIDTLP